MTAIFIHRQLFRVAAVVSGVLFWIWAAGVSGAAEPKWPEVAQVLAPVVVEGKRIENVKDVKEELARRPSSVILIEEKEIRESRGSNLNDVLQFAPGVRFQSRFGADEGKFDIRGTSLRNNFHHRGINILINGISYGNADGFSDFESIDLMAYERIEIYKGANALRYGANTIGGAINFVPRTGYNASKLQIRAEGGSYGFVKSQVSSGMVASPFKLGGMDVTADYYLSASANHQDGFQDHSEQSRQRLNANLGFRLGERQEIRFYALSANVSERLPGSLTKAQAETNRKQANSLGNFFPFACNDNQQCDQGRYYQLHRIGFAYRNEFASDQFIEISPFYQYQHLDHPIFQTLLQDNADSGLELRYSIAKSLAGHANRFVLGVQPRYGDQHQQRFVNVLGNRGLRTQNLFTRTFNMGSFAEDQFDATEAFTLIVGGRWDYSAREADAQNFSAFTGAVQNFQEDVRQYNALSPKLGFVYRTSPTAQIYGNVSRAYEAPLNLELTSTVDFNGNAPRGAFLDLDAQRAWQFELGTRGTTADKRMNWDVTVYDLEMKKEILASVINGAGTFRNANGTRHTGVEAGGGMVLGQGLLARGGGSKDDSLSTRVSYTWSRFKFTDNLFKVSGAAIVPDGTEGKTVPGAPEHMLAYELRYDHPRGFWIAPNFEWSMSGFFADNENTFKNPTFFVVHLKSGYNYNKNLTFYVEGRNLSDQTYSGAVNVNDNLGRFFNVSEGRAGYAGVEWRF